jgi:hypothetical protein
MCCDTTQFNNKNNYGGAKMKRIITLSTVMILLLAGGMVLAQDMSPQVTVQNQVISNNAVIIESVVSDGAGWLVVHADSGEGAAGPVIGFAAVQDGTNEGVTVVLDGANITPTLFAMLHEDTGEVGTYEFGTVEGEDTPVTVDDAVIAPAFEVAYIRAGDQLVSDDNTLTIAYVAVAQDGWVVIHADNGDGTPGPVLGQTFVAAGASGNVVVTLEDDATTTVFPMLHVDTGEAEVYEFGTVEGVDMPLMYGDAVAVASFDTVPSIGIVNQAVVGSDATMGETETVSLQASGVLSDGPGWLVVHADNGEGGPGEVIGFAPVSDGFNSPVVVELAAEDVTPILYPMLHEDTGEPEVYEFGEVEGADPPVMVNGSPVVVAVRATPSITFAGVLDGNVLTVDEAVIDAPGWLVIHADNNNTPGMVIGFAPLNAGHNANVVVILDEGGITGTLFPMLHYDTDTIGEYEFGTVDGADGPVVVMGEAVTGALTPEALP